MGISILLFAITTLAKGGFKEAYNTVRQKAYLCASTTSMYTVFGQNYLRSLLALGFQAFLIIVCVAIYAVLVQNIALEDDIIMAIWSCVGYTVLLCFTLFKTGSLAKSVFQAH